MQNSHHISTHIIVRHFVIHSIEFSKQMYSYTQVLCKVSRVGMAHKISTLISEIIRVVFFVAMTLHSNAHPDIEGLTNFNIMNDNKKNALPEITLKYKAGDFEKVTITQSHEAALLFRKLFDADLIEYREEFILLLLNRANKTIGYIKISTGGITGTVADPRMILSTALISGACAIMLSHNHPSGNTKPSAQDLELTKKIAAGAKMIDIQLMDHIIITTDSYYSFADNGQI